MKLFIITQVYEHHFEQHSYLHTENSVINSDFKEAMNLEVNQSLKLDVINDGVYNLITRIK